MSLHQLFCNNPRIADEAEGSFKLMIDPADRDHIRALRLNVGEHIAVVDASSDYFEVNIDKIDRDDIWVSIAQHLDAPAQTREVLLVQGLAKGDKMDTVLRQATELGIAGFFPVKMQRSVVILDQKKAHKRQLRLEAIARSAALQSGRTSIPAIHEIAPLKDVIDRWQADDAVLLFWEEASLDDSVEQLFAELTRTGKLVHFSRFWVVIGPEGGIAPEEVEAIRSSSAAVFTLSLGPTILRTETAGVVSCALVLSALRASEQGSNR